MLGGACSPVLSDENEEIADWPEHLTSMHLAPRPKFRAKNLHDLSVPISGVSCFEECFGLSRSNDLVFVEKRIVGQLVVQVFDSTFCYGHGFNPGEVKHCVTFVDDGQDRAANHNSVEWRNDLFF